MPNDMTHIDKIQALAFSIGKNADGVIRTNASNRTYTTAVLYFKDSRSLWGFKSDNISKKMYVKPSAITVMIDRLIDQELVERYHDKDDRRVVIIELTKRGNLE